MWIGDAQASAFLVLQVNAEGCVRKGIRLKSMQNKIYEHQKNPISAVATPNETSRKKKEEDIIGDVASVPHNPLHIIH